MACRTLHGHEHNRLADDRTTLAEILAAGGYATGAFISAFPAGSYFGLDQGFGVFDEDFGHESSAGGSASPVTEQGVVNTGLHQRRADATTDRAIAWLESMGESGGGPTFAWVHYFDPHNPAVLPPDDRLAGLPPLEDGEAEHLRALYDREVAYMDSELGRLLAAAQAAVGELLVAVVADHGEGLGDHDWWTHGVLYQEQIRVPMLLAGPGVRRAYGCRKWYGPRTSCRRWWTLWERRPARWNWMDVAYGRRSR